MKINQLIDKITRRSQPSTTLFAVVQSEAVYFSASHGQPLIEQYPIQAGQWLTALSDALCALDGQYTSIDIVLHAQLYQCYQIDTPPLPAQEWPDSLPFLLKDLISEKPTEIVVDAYPLSGSNKIQAYVLPVKLVLELAQMLTGLGLQLGRVIPEQEVWANTVENPHFLLLQRSRGGQFKLDAFVDERCYFQRTLRGVSAPVTGENSASLELDGLALELQRSIDYLSSQLKTTVLHQLRVCCDDEDHSQLVAALNERLNVKVSLLSTQEPQPLVGQILAQYAPLLSRPVINFYPSRLHPKKDHFSLFNVVMVGVLVSLFMLSVAGVYGYKTTRLASEITLAEQQVAQLNVQVLDLQRQQARHQPSAGKVSAIARLKQQIASQQAALTAMERFSHHQQEGYSGIMTALANVANRHVSLTAIEIAAEQLNLQGVATDAKMIPHWIGQFNQQTPLVGRNFERLVMDRNEQGLLIFELKTQQGGQ